MKSYKMLNSLKMAPWCRNI